MKDEDKVYGLIVQAEEIQQHAVDLNAAARTAAEGLGEAAQEVARALNQKTLIQSAYPLAIAILVAILTVTGLSWYVGLKRTELVELKNQAGIWEQKAGKAKLTTCGPAKRMCVKVDRKAGEYGGNKDDVWMVVSGY